uniref:Uncharacterized protein n=1 Tax=Chrysotila carterae TaxID=13221 RepID=A0A7S4BYT7_CHRCT
MPAISRDPRSRASSPPIASRRRRRDPLVTKVHASVAVGTKSVKGSTSSQKAGLDVRTHERSHHRPVEEKVDRECEDQSEEQVRKLANRVVEAPVACSVEGDAEGELEPASVAHVDALAGRFRLFGSCARVQQHRRLQTLRSTPSRTYASHCIRRTPLLPRRELLPASCPRVFRCSAAPSLLASTSLSPRLILPPLHVRLPCTCVPVACSLAPRLLRLSRCSACQLGGSPCACGAWSCKRARSALCVSSYSCSSS